jgi:uncharacterized protein YutE (UPF0331/DUF86 family)
MTAGKVDPEVVRRHLLSLAETLRTLDRHVGRPLEDLGGTEERWIVERGLQIAVQNVLDIATHLVAGAGLDASDYATAIDQLGRIGVLPNEFVASFRAIAGFRNVLVHGYVTVDLSIVHRVLNERLDDLRSFASHVERHLAKSGV